MATPDQQRKKAIEADLAKFGDRISEQEKKSAAKDDLEHFAKKYAMTEGGKREDK